MEIISAIVFLLTVCLSISSVSGGFRGCARNRDPVCGRNGKTYINNCLAKKAGAQIMYRGECKRTPGKNMGLRGNTNSKLTLGATMFTSQKLRDRDTNPGSMHPLNSDSTENSRNRNCGCRMRIAIVCATDGKTYPNQCSAECAGERVTHTGKCTDNRDNSILKSAKIEDDISYGGIDRRTQACSCSYDVVSKVCGMDRRTYLNPCFAECAGTSERYEGECKFGG